MQTPTLWNEEFSVGHKLMDDQHHWLFDILNRLKQKRIQNDKDLLLASIEELFQYCREHFHSEEALMEDISFSQLAEHKKEHEAFKNRILELQEEAKIKETDYIQNEVVDFLTDWLKHHILNKDKQYQDFLEKGDYQKKVNAKPRLIITGASGLIGENLANYLCVNYSLIGLSRKKRENTFLMTWYRCDIGNSGEIDKTFEEIFDENKNIAGVIHLAAHIDFQDRPSDKWNDVNVEGTRGLLRACEKYHIKNFIYASSIVVMGSSKKLALLNEESSLETIMNYGQSKVKSENIVNSFKDRLKVVILRISTVYTSGPHLSYLNFQLANCFNQTLADRFLPSMIGGVAYINVIDVCHAFEKVLVKVDQLNSGEIFIISEEGYLPHISLYREIAKDINKKYPSIFSIDPKLAGIGATILDKILPEKKGEKIRMKPWMAQLSTLSYCFDNTKAKNVLEWTPQFHITTHLKLMLQDLALTQKRWISERGLINERGVFKFLKKLMLKTWDNVIGPLAKDIIKLISALFIPETTTLIGKGELRDHYYETLGESHKEFEQSMTLNLHAISFPFHIPWRVCRESFYRSWPNSLIQLSINKDGFSYLAFNKYPVLKFEKTERVDDRIQFRVTEGFAPGAEILFSQQIYQGQRYFFIETRVPKTKLFPEKIHNQYTCEHLINLTQNVFLIKLNKGESYAN
jgi:hemerythrin-like metal-binding protein